jgi:hypothetical protein
MAIPAHILSPLVDALAELYPEAAMRFLQSLQASPRLEQVLSDWALERDAEAILRRYTDQDFSYVDAVSFAVMRAQNITDVFGFDGHFRIMGFVLRL